MNHPKSALTVLRTEDFLSVDWAVFILFIGVRVTVRKP